LYSSQERLALAATAPSAPSVVDEFFTAWVWR
jgi:hypothetical protein